MAWKRRWFVLDSKELKYYKDKTDTTPAGTVAVADMISATESSDPTKEVRPNAQEPDMG